ncbi:RHS repeat-associated core domain-containing protein, partial [Candidatus Sumerlaeota bacterium]
KYLFESSGSPQYSDWRAQGMMTKRTDPYGNETTTYYDQTEARKTKVVAPSGTYVVPTYDNDGNVITKTVYDSSDNVLAKQAFVYDAYGQLRTKTVDPDDLAYDTIYEYNGLGQVTKTQSGCGCSAGSGYYWYDNTGQLTAAKGAISGAVATEYYPDKLGNVTKLRAPIGDGTTYAEAVKAYDDGGRVTKVTDPESVVTEMRYDTEFRVTQVKDALNGETEYEYDYWNKLTKLIDPRDKQTTYEYDCFGRLTKKADDEGNGSTFEYDANGNVTKTTDAKSVSTTLEYDDANVVTRANRPGGEYEVAYDYDTQRGLLTRLEELSGGDVLTYDYDKLGQLTKESYQDASANIQYEYNDARQLTRMALPLVGSGNVYDYDDEGQLTKISSTTDPNASYLYDDDLRPTKVTYDNLTYTEYEYDKGGRLTRQETRHNYAGQLCAFDYYYDDAGNRTKVVLDDDANDWLQYDYDDLYRLTREQRSGTANDYTNRYYYDAVGNRTQSSRTTDGYAYLSYFYNDINQLTMYNDPDEAEYPDQVRMSYDANGNMTNRYRAVYSEGMSMYEPDYDNFTQYMWDSRNLLTKVTTIVGGDSTDYTFAYDALGRRESMTAGGTTTDYFYEGLGVLVEKTGAVTKTYLNSGTLVGGIICVDDGDDVTYFHYDAIGNVVATTDDIGDVDSYFVQDAFGNVFSGTASGYHLTTKEYFDDFGLYYFNARWYDPFTGRFISKGPMRPDKEHPYVLCRGNPISFVDVDGNVAPAVGALIVFGGILWRCVLPYYAAAQIKYGMKSDRFLHCWTSCMISRDCGSLISIWAGLGKEAKDLILEKYPGLNKLDELRKDMKSNLAGIDCAGFETHVPLVGWATRWFRQSCKCCCEEYVAGGPISHDGC